MTYILHRTRCTPEGTFGILYADRKPLCVTCEDPWNGNKTGASCIPPGTYRCVPHSGARFKNVWEVIGVPSRSAILIHNGNTIKDTEGCILVGKSFDTLGGLPCVTESVSALNMLRMVLPKEFPLTVINGSLE